MTIRVGLIGTGYAAHKRAEALTATADAELVAIAGTTSRAQSLSQAVGAKLLSWQAIAADPELDLVIIATINRLHAPIAEAALKAKKHVVVEYPLAITPSTAAGLIELAQTQERLLHVEHIELLGGLHQAMRSHLSRVGKPQYVSYRTLNPKRPAPAKWSYRLDLAGFPFVAALSRIHRLTDLFGEVSQVYCQSWFNAASAAAYYSTCLCSAQLRFASGLIAEVTYGKGENLWRYSRRVEIQGTDGSLVFDRDHGELITAQGTTEIAVAPRHGLFTRDTAAVIHHLSYDRPLYSSAAASLYSLRVADALRQSAESGQAVSLRAKP
ncbi:MAG: Gfo/Idh/MocA family oxidoreductase [Leptolyngbya sp. SIO4C1]|nr:Gfo/Idh/MocA family oxidoreductase [Leptolyngbya sp. SIO4C1]